MLPVTARFMIKNRILFFLPLPHIAIRTDRFPIIFVVKRNIRMVLPIL